MCVLVRNDVVLSEQNRNTLPTTDATGRSLWELNSHSLAVSGDSIHKLQHPHAGCFFVFFAFSKILFRQCHGGREGKAHILRHNKNMLNAGGGGADGLHDRCGDGDCDV